MPNTDSHTNLYPALTDPGHAYVLGPAPELAVLGSTRRYVPTDRKTPRWQAIAIDGVTVLADCLTLKEAKAIVMDKGHEVPAPYDGRTPADVPGLAGKALQTYLDTGLTLVQQLHAAQLTNYNASETNTMTTLSAAKAIANQTQPARKVKAAKAPTTGLTAAEVARTNDLDPRKFRQFLRGADIARTFADKKAATAAVKAFRKGN